LALVVPGLWIILPDACPDAVQKALLWFYDPSSDTPQPKKDEMENALKEILGEDLNEESNGMMDLTNGQEKEIFCKKDVSTGYDGFFSTLQFSLAQISKLFTTIFAGK